MPSTNLLAAIFADQHGGVAVNRRMTLLRGDNVWEQFLEETERFLTLRQYAVAVIALMETSLQLQNLHLPWLSLLRRPVVE